jgi:hypothetical protein
MDYPFLQPKYLEWEMRGCPLHLYTSMFWGGPILLGVELLEPVEALLRVVLPLDKPEEDPPVVEAPPRAVVPSDEPEEVLPALEVLPRAVLRRVVVPAE